MSGQNFGQMLPPVPRQTLQLPSTEECLLVLVSPAEFSPATLCAQMREKNRRSRGINYNNEVAFEQRPAPGFYDTAAEQATTREVGREFRPTTVEEIEGKRPRVRFLSCVLQSGRGQPVRQWIV